MSVSHLSLLEQPRGTGPPGDQTASECQPGVWVLPPSPTNNSGLRSGAHDPERPGEVVAQRGCGWSGLVHPRDARVAGLNNSRAPLNRLGSISQPFLQHFHDSHRCNSRTDNAKLKKLVSIPRSSNGRTAAFGAVNRGSNPCRGAIANKINRLQ